MTINGSTVTYTPNAGFSGADTFQYTIGDPGGLTDSGTVSVTVDCRRGSNRAPIAGNDTFSFTLPRLGSILPAAVATIPGVLANDTDADGNPLTAVLVAGPAADPLAPGFPQILLGAEGSIQYADGLGIAQATQPITFTYAANDGQANSNVATVTINLVQPVGQPIAFDDAITTPQDTLVRIDADSNDNANGAPGNAIRQAAASFIVRRSPSTAPSGRCA